MRNKIFIFFFALSLVGIFLEIFLGNGPDAGNWLMSGQGIIYFSSLFFFWSLPFLLAYYLDWAKGFGLSILTSLITLWAVTTYLGGISRGEGYPFLINTSFALFSVLYLYIAFVISVFRQRPIKKLALLVCFSPIIIIATYYLWAIIYYVLFRN